MNVLILGSGGRENALAYKIAQSEILDQLYCLPGNPGTLQFATNLEGSLKDFETIKSAVIEHNIHLVVVGPEDPLVNGLYDYFKADSSLKNVLFIGPSKVGAALEGSKAFAKAFFERNNIPTARYKNFTLQNYDEGCEFIDSLQAPYVLKADGLAAGKGVLIIEDACEAKKSLHDMLSGQFGEASKTVVIEEYLHGIELSVFVLTDSESYMILPEAKDYKRIGDEDTGLNTGGMGAVSPVWFADEVFMKKVEQRIVIPTVEAFKREGIDYKGFVFIGIMNCAGEPYVIEYNVRMGDPETEAVMCRIESDFLKHLVATAMGNLGFEKLLVSPRFAVTVVTVSGGYPQEFTKGYEIEKLDRTDNGADSCINGFRFKPLKIIRKGEVPISENTYEENRSILFHSGTQLIDGKLCTSGGRVFALTAMGESLRAAKSAAYTEIRDISYLNMYYRRDIGNDLLI